MNLHDVLQVLVTSENDAGAVYETIAGRNEGEVARTSLVFAEQERRHAQRIKTLVDQVDGMDELVNEDMAKLLTLYVIESETKRELKSASRKQLFRYALQIEKDSVLLYQEIAGFFEPETPGRNQFDALVTEERAHMYFVLKQLHDLE